MYISKINIQNFKCFKEKFTLSLNQKINIIVGNNGEGKSTILEAINIGLQGIFNGRYIKNELSEYLFNKEIVKEYIEGLKINEKKELPKIIIEIFLEGEGLEILKGTNNTDREDQSGIKFEIAFDEDMRTEYEELLKNKGLLTLPLEYYKIIWKSFADLNITPRSIPIKTNTIDSTSKKLLNGSDLYISRIVQNNLDDKEKIGISQEHRNLKEVFIKSKVIESINKKLSDSINGKNLEISVDLNTRDAWEKSLMTFLEGVPFHQLGKGNQSIIKAMLSLTDKKNISDKLLLIEEPENHLSHTKLNELIKLIVENSSGKQVIITTHSNFVSNKLGLDNLIILNNLKSMKLKELTIDTQKFFKKLPGYNTLRLILGEKTILVEGDSEELIFQKAYYDIHNKLPIENNIEIISVALTFKRFLEIAEKINQKVCVITDNDKNYKENILNKYKQYEKYENIKIFASDNNDLHTLEPQIVEVNDLNELASIVRKQKIKNETSETLVQFLKNNKAEWALRVFESEKTIKYPDYIKKALDWCNE